MNYIDTTKELINTKNFSDITLSEENVQLYKERTKVHRNIFLACLLCSIFITFVVSFTKTTWQFVIGIVLIVPLMYLAKKASDSLKVMNKAFSEYIKGNKLNS